MSATRVPSRPFSAIRPIAARTSASRRSAFVARRSGVAATARTLAPANVNCGWVRRRGNRPESPVPGAFCTHTGAKRAGEPARRPIPPPSMPQFSCPSSARDCARAATRRSRRRGPRARPARRPAGPRREQVGLHRLADAVDVRLAEPEPEAAADDHGLDVEHVDARRDAGAERLDRASISSSASSSPRSSARDQTPLVSRVRPRSSMILNSGSCWPSSTSLARARAPSPGGRRRPPCSPGARTGIGAAHLHDDVADLAGRVAAEPRLAVEHDAAADAGAPEHAEHRAGSGRPAPSSNSASVATCTSLPSATGAPQRAPPTRRAGRSCRSSPAGSGAGDGAGRVVDLAGGADADADQRRGLDARALGRLAAARRRSPPPRRPGCPWSGSGGATGRATSWSSSMTTAWIFVPPRSMPPR